MARINLGRVILGGLIAGVVINVFEYFLNGVVLASQWTDLMASLHRPAIGMNQIIVYNVMDFALGLAAVWTYAAMRPRFGAGPKTAVYAALLIWVVGYALADASTYVSGLFTSAIFLTLIGVGLIEIVVATVVGAYLYKESP
ncbi:MAG: hypothetical protein WCA81_06915 [Rhizomicrobium sp.]